VAWKKVVTDNILTSWIVWLLLERKKIEHQLSNWLFQIKNNP